ncbi:uncharacterized protein LOC135827599 [Sycon ciliatum]|uniref:uncharacterized protein LOC135827599 n=1 Tax=Sycon ciliatum TaxID=27933 RepID=UPI0020AD7E39|eukprot:scpid64890/ scgid14764/ 
MDTVGEGTSEVDVREDLSCGTVSSSNGTVTEPDRDAAEVNQGSATGLSARDLSALDKSAQARHIREIGIFSAQRNFQELFNCLDQNYRGEFLRWISEEYDARRRTSFLSYTLGMGTPGQKVSVESISGLEGLSADHKLQAIAVELREQLPAEAMAPQERVVFPTHGANADCAVESTMHVDSFLYTDDEVDFLTETGKLPRHYCADCKSRNIKSLVYVSHSASVCQLRHVYTSLLPSLEGKKVVDVGSRLGNCLYGGYFYSEASQLIGVEIDKFFCDLSQSTLEKHGMTDRCQVINSDIRQQADLLKSADVVILNNVFEFFLTDEEQRSIWLFLYESIRRNGCYLVTVPSLSKTFSTLGISDINLSQWVSHADPLGIGSIRPDRPQDVNGTFSEDEQDDDEDSELAVFHVYTTL